MLEHNNTIMYSGENHGLIWGGVLEHIYTIVVTLSLSLCSAFNFNWWSKEIFQFDHTYIFVQYWMVTIQTLSAEPNILIMGGHGSGWAGPVESWNAPSSCSQLKSLKLYEKFFSSTPFLCRNFSKDKNSRFQIVKSLTKEYLLQKFYCSTSS